MNSKIYLVILITTITFCSCFTNKSNGELVGLDTTINVEKNTKKLIPKTGKKYFEGMVYLQGRVISSIGTEIDVTPTDNDSTLITYYFSSYFSNYRTESVQGFFMSDHEVTNLEYRTFTNWVKNNQKNNYSYTYHDVFINTTDRKIDLISKSTDVYPNTSCWKEEFSSMPEASKMSKEYFTNSVYDNYPVVGVTWEQANAYCIWRTDRLNEQILQEANEDSTIHDFSTAKYNLSHPDDEIQFTPNFRLPSIEEWECAAQSNVDFEAPFPWGTQDLKNKKGNYLANLGQLKSDDNTITKPYGEFESDKDLFTKEVKSFASNNDIYDMAGNVAEWLSTPVFDITNNYDLNPLPSMLSDTTIMEKFVKGGSWADRAIYLSWKTNTGLHKNQSSSRIGFRVAMFVPFGVYSGNRDY
jgi:formylglycine-generating enzyme required for sulfatase activity